jgi:hypothetical protein
MKIRLFILFIIIPLFISCEADVNLNDVSTEVGFEPGILVPLGGVNVNLGDLIKTYDSGNFVVKDSTQIIFQSSDSLNFKAPKIDLLQNSKSLIKSIFLSPSGTFTFPKNTNIPEIVNKDTFNLGINKDTTQNMIDSIKISSAVLGVKISVNSLAINPSNLSITLEFPVDKMRKVDHTSTALVIKPSAFNTMQNISINNVVLNTRGGTSGIPLVIKLQAKTGNSPITVTPDSRIDLELQFNSLTWSVVYGKFDPSNFVLDATEIPLNLGNSFKNGTFNFSNPQIDISAVSNIGMKLGFRLDYLRAISGSKTVDAVFKDSKTYTQFFLNKPKLPGDTAHINLPAFDKNFGQTDKLIAIKPDILQYNFTLLSRNESSEFPNFITPDGNININFKTKIPIEFNSGTYLEYKDSIPNAFNILADAVDKFKIPYTDSTSIESASLVLNIINGLPIHTILSITIFDSIGNKLNLPADFNKDYEIYAGSVDINGIVQPGKEKKQTLYLNLAKNQLSELKKANKIVYKVRVEGNQLDPKINFTKLNNFGLKIGFYIKGKLIKTF